MARFNCDTPVFDCKARLPERAGGGGFGDMIVLALYACIAYNTCMQYTIRNIPDYLDAALRASAREQGKSLNEVAVETMVRGAGLGDQRIKRRDLSDIVGTWVEDPAFDEAIAEQDTIDEEMWK
jgi:hypothetical protein